MRFKSLLVLIMSLIMFHSVTADNAFNALWNEDSKSGMVGFWLYPDVGACPDLRVKSQPLALGGKIKNGSTLVNDLNYCFQINTKKPKEHIVCKSGYINVTKNQSNNTYSGSYKILLSDGIRKEGDINALFCPASE